VRHLPVRGGVSVVRRCLVPAPFAVTSDGTLLINVATLTKATDFESIVRAAREEKAGVFIGVILRPMEARFAMARVENAADEAAARIVGERARLRAEAQKKK
jgi:hypothetical protein